MTWPNIALGEISQIITGSTPKNVRAKIFGGSLPFVTPGDLDSIEPIGSSERSLSTEGAREVRTVPPGSVLICCIGSLGKIGIAGREVATNQQINSVVFDQTRILPKYGYYACRLLKPKLLSMAPATTVAIVSKSKLEALAIAVPPIPEQLRIAAVLDQAEALQAKRRAALAKLEMLTQAIFVEMFGSCLDESRWSTSRLEASAQVVSGVAKGAKFNGRATVMAPYLRVANVQAGFLDLREMKDIEALPSEVEELQLKAGDVVMTEGGDYDKLGRGAMWDGSIQNCIHQNHVFRVRVDQTMLLPRFFQEFLQTKAAKSYFLRCAKKTTNLASINMTQLRDLPVPLPALDLQRCFVQKAGVVAAIKRLHEQGLSKLDALFASLQHRAFRGEL